jgi:hypothetical protein
MTKDDEHTGCGISPLATGEQDPFFKACAWHDNAYLKGSLHQDKYSRAKIDEQFLQQMLEIAGDSWILRLRAHIYYTLARALGGQFWEGKK